MGENNGGGLNVAAECQHELSTQTSNEGTGLCAQHCNLWMFLLEKHQWWPLGSVPLQCFTVMHCSLNTLNMPSSRTELQLQCILKNVEAPHVTSNTWCAGPLTVCARWSCSGRVAGFGRCRVSTVLRTDGTDWGWEDMLAQPLPLQAGSGCGSRADAVHYWLFVLASNLYSKKKICSEIFFQSWAASVEKPWISSYL